MAAQQNVGELSGNTWREGWLLPGSALIAALFATLLPLIAGVAAGWTPWRSGAYAGLALLFVGLVALHVSQRRPEALYCRWPWLPIGLLATLGFGLTVLSGDSLIQPTVFTVPFVFMLLGPGPRAALPGGTALLALAAAGLWLHDRRPASAIAYSVLVYASLMVFMAAFVNVARQQSVARERADALAAENARLAAEAALSATLAERNRIARELHDTIAQGLTAVTMQLEAAERAFTRDPERARSRLGRAHQLARETLAEVRRSVWLLAAPALEGPALGAALAELVCRFSERSGVAAAYRHEGPALSLASERAVQVLRIVQEALQNVEKHAQARTVEVVTRTAADGAVAVLVRDDGRGFDPASPAAAPDGGFGLPSLRERARLAGGQLVIASRPGHGTTVALELSGEP
ncbi:MAG: sensor histidine kinase [Chloroflexi bacterium]|nr:sensor histidine kinase [Chloroflexota bacterium]